MYLRTFLAKTGAAVGDATLALPLMGCERADLIGSGEPSLATDTVQTEKAPAPDQALCVSGSRS